MVRAVTSLMRFPVVAPAATAVSADFTAARVRGGAWIPDETTAANAYAANFVAE